MGKSSLPNRKTTSAKDIPEITKSKLNKNLGVYTFIDEDGNVVEIKKEKKSIKKYYPNEPTKVDNVIGDVYVIGISDTIAMGVGDATMAYAKYN